MTQDEGHMRLFRLVETHGDLLLGGDIAEPGEESPRDGNVGNHLAVHHEWTALHLQGEWR
jgi:hypothetical protein